MQQFDIDTTLVVLRYFDFIYNGFPPSFPIFFNTAYNFCLIRLLRENIRGAQPEKTVEGARLKSICFDKTGTLTEKTMEVSKIYQISQENSFE